MPFPSINANIGVSIAARLTGLRVEPYQATNFVVEIEGILAGGFTECSGLEVEVDVHEYEEGGQNEFVHRFAGRAKHPRFVLKHGLSPFDGLWGWHQDVVRGNVQRHNGTIYLLNKQAIPLRWWNFTDALPVKWSGPSLSAASAAVAFESVELVHRGLSRAQQATAETAVSVAVTQLAAAAIPNGGFF